ncbi:MAG: DNA polymerase III subunit delta' [Bordetella sp.]|nr:MAG: DNA polymerase III subunit delta' [Bordetella sp.]
MKMFNFLPWQIAEAENFLSNKNRLGHAWIIHGSHGIGKLNFAFTVAACLLCENSKNNFPCMACSSCNWLSDDNHPDLKLISPESIKINHTKISKIVNSTIEPKKNKTLSREIRINQIRELELWFNTTTYREGWRIIILFPSESLNEISGNALLKILEEPPKNTLFLIIAAAIDKLLPTVVSRCQKFKLSIPDQEVASKWLNKQGVEKSKEWLAAAGGAPIAALQSSTENKNTCPLWIISLLNILARDVQPKIDDLFKICDKNLSVHQMIDTLQKVCIDIVLIFVGNENVRYFPILQKPIEQVVYNTDFSSIINMSHWLLTQKKIATYPINMKFFFYVTIKKFGNIFLNNKY